MTRKAGPPNAETHLCKLGIKLSIGDTQGELCSLLAVVRLERKESVQYVLLIRTISFLGRIDPSTFGRKTEQ